MMKRERTRPVRVFLKHLLGWLCIVFGLIMLVTPGQGILTLIAGIYLLADEIPFFARIKRYLLQKFPKAAALAERMKRRFSSDR